MKRVAASLLCRRPPWCWPLAIAGIAQDKPATPPSTNDPRVGAEAGLPRRRPGRAQHGAGRDDAEADGFFDPKAPAGIVRRRAADRGGVARRCGDAGRRRRRPPRRPRRRHRRTPPTPPPADPDAAPRRPPPRRRRRRRAELRQLRHRVPPRRHVPRQLQRLQHLRHRDAEEAAAARLGRLPRRAGRHVGPRQPAVHVGRADARPRRLRHAGRDRDGRAPSGSAASASSTSPTSASRSRSPRSRRCRGSHTHTLVDRSEGQGQHLHLRLGHRRRCARARSSPAARAKGPDEDPNTALFSIDVIKVPLAAPAKAAIVNRPRIFADPKTGAIAGLVAGRRPRRRHAGGARHEPVPRHHRVSRTSGSRRAPAPGNGILLDISDPVNPVRLDAGRRQELRLLALGDVQQRRHQGDLHRRVGRRHAAALPRDRSARPGAPTPSSTSSTRSCSSAATSRCRRRRPTRRTASRTTARSFRCRGATSWSRRWYQGGVSVFDFTDSAQAGRDRLLRSRPDRRRRT